MGYFDKDYLEHHGILGQKHGRRNGPPYPLGSGDHSSAEKKAASAAGVKVGSDSGKGSIENVKKPGGGSGGSSSSKTKKAPLTEEEKRLKAEEARLKGDSKNINKYMDKLTTDELRDAQTRAQIKKSLAEEKQSKADKEKKEAMLSGDKEKVKEYADKMTYYELQEAMNKVDLMQKLNYKPPEPTTMDKINSAMKKVDTARDWMDKGLKAYDALAAINNTFNKDHKWPRAEFGGNKNNDEKKKDSFENTAKKLIADAQNTKAQNDQKASSEKNRQIANRELDQKEEELKFQKQKYEDSKKAEAKAEKKAEDAKRAEEKAAKAEAKAEKKAEREAEREQELDDFYQDTPVARRVTSEDLTRNENAMFEAISSPNAFDSNGNFNWEEYEKRR